MLRHDGPVRLAAFSPDGSRLLTTSDLDGVQVWQIDPTGDPRTFRYSGRVWAASFSPDGSRIVTAPDDSIARVWQADGTGAVVEFGHKAAVRAATIIQDGTRLLTATADGTVHARSLLSRDLQRSLAARTTICLDPDFREKVLGETSNAAQDRYEGCELSNRRGLHDASQ